MAGGLDVTHRACWRAPVGCSLGGGAGNRTSVSHRCLTSHATRIPPGHRHFDRLGSFIRFHTVLYNPGAKLITRPIPRTGNKRKHETPSNPLGYLRQDRAPTRTLRRRTRRPRAKPTSEADQNRGPAIQDLEPATPNQRPRNQPRPRFLPSSHTRRSPPPRPRQPPSHRRRTQPESQQDT